ncbi:MAG: NAD-dependent epimerase/dehydratase family protein [Nannocystaceae bacterium]|nr:NAD-dependent epimerase/dehydratase family protein [Nannocystaceae bacterium]
MTVVVTGATGHVGGNLVRTLLERGEKVRVLVHRSRESLTDLDVEFVQGGVHDVEALRRALDGAKTLYHLAAMISIVGDADGRVFRTNVDGARNVATVAREVGVGRMVHFSSVHAFDHSKPGEINEEAPRVSNDPARHFAYDRSKAMGEAAVREQVALGLDAVIVHPSGVIGPNDFAPSRFGKAMLSMAKGHLPALTPGGYDWVDVRDVVSTVIAAAERGRTGQSYLVTGHYVELKDISQRICAITGARAPLFTVPLAVAEAVAPIGAFLARALKAEPLFTDESLSVLNTGVRFNHGLAKAELGHEPRDFEATLGDTLRWFRESGHLKG